MRQNIMAHIFNRFKEASPYIKFAICFFILLVVLITLPILIFNLHA